MLESYDNNACEDGVDNTRPAFDPPELTRKMFQAFNQHAPQASLNIA